MLALVATGCAPPPLPTSRESKAEAPLATTSPSPKPDSDNGQNLKVVTATSRRFLDGLTLEVIAGRRRVEILRQAPEFAGVTFSDADKAAWGKRVAATEAARAKAEQNLATEILKVAPMSPAEWEQGLFVRNPDAGDLARLRFASNTLRNSADRVVATYSLADVVKMPDGPGKDGAFGSQFNGICNEVGLEVENTDSYKRARKRIEKGPDLGD